MAKTPKNEPSAVIMMMPSAVSTTAPTTTMISTMMATTPASPSLSSTAGSASKLKRKVPFKKVFSSSHLQTNNIGCGIGCKSGNNSMINKHDHAMMDCKTLKPTTDTKTSHNNRGSVSSIQSFHSLSKYNSQLSSSLPGMFHEIEQQQQQKQRKKSENQFGSSPSHQSSKTLKYSNQQHSQSPPQSNTVINDNNANVQSSSPSLRTFKNIPVAAIEPSLIGSLSTYLSQLKEFDATKFIKEIELMLKYFEDAFKKDKLELLNGSCNILIETIAVNCSRLRDAYLHLQQVQLRLQILSNIHIENENCDDLKTADDVTGSSSSSTIKRNPIIEATNELNKNLSDLVKWSDEIYLRQQLRHLDLEDGDDDDIIEQDLDQSIPEELIESGAQISRRVFISFKNLVKAYKSMEEELRKCYEEYLYQNSKLVELIMAENNNQNNQQRQLNHHQVSLTAADDKKIRDSIQTLLRRRSITPPPEWNGRMDSLVSHNPHFRMMGNGSTSTISSSISSQSTNSSNSSASTSSSTSSNVFRTHRFIPTIISHQAQKMAQHFELKKFRTPSSGFNKKMDSTSSLKHPQPSKMTENQTMLSFLFGISGVSSGSLKRSESANNIHRINHNILLPSKHLHQFSSNQQQQTQPYDVIPTLKPSAMIFDSKFRKHSINNQEILNGTSQDSSNNNKDSIKRNANSKPNSPKHQPVQMRTTQQSKNSDNDNITIESNPPPPPLPPKTYQKTNITNGRSLNNSNNSGRSSIASNTSSMSSSSSLTSTATSASSNLSYSHHSSQDKRLHNNVDSDSGLGTASLPSSNSQDSLKQIISSGSKSSKKSLSSSSSLCSEDETIYVLVNNNNNSNNNNHGSSIDQNSYSQVTLRPKKVRQRKTQQVVDCNTKNCTEGDHNNHINQNRPISPPPLPPIDSAILMQCCSTLITTTSATDSFSKTVITTNATNSNVDVDQSSLDSRCLTTSSTNCCGCCCCCSASSILTTPSVPSNNKKSSSVVQRQIRTYRKPLPQQHTLLSQTKSCLDYPLPSSMIQCSTPSSMYNGRTRRSSLMHSLSTNVNSDLPPPLPPKRNLHAYMGMVGNYVGPTNQQPLSLESESLDQIRSKSMFCEPITLSTMSLSSSISTTNTSVSSTQSLSHSPITISNNNIKNDDSDPYQHLPLAPPPPLMDNLAPSPPPTLPPRRDKLGDIPAPPPPPPPIQRTSTNRSCHHNNHYSRPRSSTPINANNTPHPQRNLHNHHQHHHHNHHNHDHCNHDPIIHTKQEAVECEHKQESNNLKVCHHHSHHNHQIMEKERILEEETDDDDEGKVSSHKEDDDDDEAFEEEEEEEDDNDDQATTEPEITCCPYCSEGTIHPEDDCILAQVELSPDLFLYQNDDGSSVDTTTTNTSTTTATMMLMNSMNIRGGTIDALLIKATQASLNSDDETFVDCFLCTYRSFISIHELLKKLTFRYRYFSEKSTNQTDIVHQSVARKVVTFITLLIGEIYIYDFDKPLLETMMEFIYQLVTKGDLVNAKFLREKCYEKLRLKEREFRRQHLNNNIIHNDANNNNNSNDSSKSSLITTITNHVHLKTWTLLDFKAEHLAEQMTLLDSRLFNKIELPEILIWAKEQKEESIPNLSQFTEHFNNMSYWARSQILTCHDQKEREKYMLKFLKIMKYLRKLNNFNSYLAILSALDSAPISRLDWPKNVTDMIKDYGSLIDSSSSFRTYRNILANSKPPCIPYIGLILQDLTFVHIGNSDILQDGKINWCKYFKQYNILRQMNQFKQCQYSIVENENILMFFDRFEDHLPEDVMWQISDSLKPRITSISNLNANNSSNNNQLSSEQQT